MHTVAIGIQARLSSQRFPKKVLAQLQQVALIEHIYRNCALTGLPTFILTSVESSDDELVDFATNNGWFVFRGDLENVLDRFCDFGSFLGVDYVIRVSADSPLLHTEVINLVYNTNNIQSESPDLVTNLFPRTFPKGQSVEMIKVETLIELTRRKISKSDLEHVTSFIYEDAKNYRIINCRSEQDLSRYRSCIDYPEDLLLMEEKLNSVNLDIRIQLPDWKTLSNHLYDLTLTQ